MSLEYMAAAWKIDFKAMGITEPIAPFIFLAYADHADQLGHNVRPSKKLIAWKTSVSRMTVVRTTNKFVQVGLFIIHERGGGRRVSRYSIDLSKAIWKAPFETYQNVTPAVTSDVTSAVSPVLHEPSNKPPKESIGYAIPKALRNKVDAKPFPSSQEPKDKAGENVDNLHPLELRVAKALHKKTLGKELRDLLAKEVEGGYASPIAQWDTWPDLFPDYVDERILYWLSLPDQEPKHLVHLIRKYHHSEFGWEAYRLSRENKKFDHSDATEAPF